MVKVRSLWLSFYISQVLREGEQMADRDPLTARLTCCMASWAKSTSLAMNLSSSNREVCDYF